MMNTGLDVRWTNVTGLREGRPVTRSAENEPIDLGFGRPQGASSFQTTCRSAGLRILGITRKR
jgi:hypothetical protein